MALTAEEKAQLEQLTAKANEPDSSDDFEIEVFSPEGHGARVPYSKGRSYLQQHFGIDLDPDPETEAGKDSDGGSDPKAGKKGKPQAPQGEGRSGSYWTRKSRA
jgi:hypothetical protein